MQYVFEILRRDNPEAPAYVQEIPFETDAPDATCASALTELNTTLEKPIRWECSCLQKKCGACAMRINGRPMLACDAKLCEVQHKGRIRLEPLRKFPVIADLTVDRRILFANLQTIRCWLDADTIAKGKKAELAYEASRCLQCGCCLEICPNFCAGGKFFGMATVPITTRLLSQMTPKEYKEIARLYARHTFAGCGKSLACRDVCPKGIDTERLLVNANAMAIWKRK